MDIQEYIKAIDEQWLTGNATEHSYRPALQRLLSDMLPSCTVTNEPSRRNCGAPDYIITQKKGARQPIFFIEAKNLFDNDIDGMRNHKEQFDRYKASLEYILFTDYLDFHLYEHGEWVRNIRIGEQQGNHIRMIKGVEQDFADLIAHLADSRPQPITTPSRLAKQMASKARLLADVVTKAFHNAQDKTSVYYHDNSQMEGQLQAFRNILIHDLEPEGFADVYAQTIAYGMFAARLHDDTPEDFSRQEAAELIPKTNPFLRQIFQQIAGYDLDERIAWIVDDLAQTFLVTDVEKVMKAYTGNALHSDPMIHFYENFLSEYNPKLRKSKGVWYTPQPVVRFIVKAVDEILQRDFHLPMGLADHSKVEHEVVNDQWDGKKAAGKTIKRLAHRVQILDPATGTGTFLAEVVSQIYSKFQGMQGMWQGYAEEHLLPRLHGFELLMASYAVAHLKLDMQLRNMGYDSAKARDQRLRIYLTNSLEECHPDTGTLWAQWLSTEANQANYIKRDCPVMVMIGNPPYSGESQNKGEWIMHLMEDYKKEPGGNEQLKERNPKWINDDYVKFIRLAQSYIERNKRGVIGFINPHGYLSNPTFRGMRWNLLKTFDKIYTIDLHGNSKKKETCPDGSKDENVFDIMQGVSINIFVKTGEKAENELGKVYHKDLYGLREDKYEFLNSHTLDTTCYEELYPQAPMYFFVPKDYELEEEFNHFIGISSLFTMSTVGVVTANDKTLIAQDKYSLLSKVNNELLITPDANLVKKVDYRPFDNQFVYYDTKIVERAREKVMKHLLFPNNALVIGRQGQVCGDNQWNLVYIVCDIVDFNVFYRGGGMTFPLYLYTTAIDGTEEKVPNLNKEEWAKFDAAVGRETTPEELLDYIYAVLHSPVYRERYKEFLKTDFPRIPLPQSEEEFMRLGALGHQLIDLHLMRNAETWKLQAQFPIAGDCMIDNIKAIANDDDGASVEVYINDTQYFSGVPITAWNAYIGGYQPAQKWLKDRKGRTLAFDDILHYLRIIHALTETQSIMHTLATTGAPSFSPKG